MLNKEQLDLLKKVEELTAKLNESIGNKTKPMLTRYPLIFALLVIVGATMVSQGIKDLILEIYFLKGSPWVMLFLGMIILIITGTLYKNLDK